MDSTRRVPLCTFSPVPFPPVPILFYCLFFAISACSTLPEVKHTQYDFPDSAFIGDVKRAYQKIGVVRSRVDFASLDSKNEESNLCKNYFNKAVRDLLKKARARHADAVIDVKSVVFLVDGRSELYPDPECSDDGEQGQVLTQGLAVKWIADPVVEVDPRDAGKFVPENQSNQFIPEKKPVSPNVPAGAKRVRIPREKVRDFDPDLDAKPLNPSDYSAPVPDAPPKSGGRLDLSNPAKIQTTQ